MIKSNCHEGKKKKLKNQIKKNLIAVSSQKKREENHFFPQIGTDLYRKKKKEKIRHFKLKSL